MVSLMAVSETYQRPVPVNFTGNIDLGIRIAYISLLLIPSVFVSVSLPGTSWTHTARRPTARSEDFIVELRGAEYGDLPDATAGTQATTITKLVVCTMVHVTGTGNASRIHW